MELRDAAKDYEAKGPRYSAARRILERGCEIPPSLEVFEHILETGRKTNPSLTPEGMARRVSESYHRTAWNGPEDGN
jgi:hypothetical protein